MSTTLSSTRWTGISPAITTKFHADESIDAEGTMRHIDFQIRNGIHGLVTCGSCGSPGETSTLTLDEKLDVARIALQAADGRIPVLASVSDTSNRSRAPSRPPEVAPLIAPFTQTVLRQFSRSIRSIEG